MKKCIKIGIVLLAVFFSACSPDENDFAYERENSENMYDALRQDGRFDILLEAIDSLNYDDALKYTLNTVLAPPDSVFEIYLKSKGYSNLNEMPREELKRLIEHHVLAWMYPSGQFKEKPKVFRRETKVAMPDKLEMVKGEEYLIRKDNKWMAFLTPEFFEAYGGSADDYEAFYGHPMKELNVYGIGVSQLDWLTGNGWIQVVDNVVEPVRNLHDWLTEEEHYSIFASLIDRFRVLSSTSADENGNPRFYNHNEVIPNVHYLLAGFWPDDENFTDTHQSSKFLTMVAYSDDAMEKLFDEYLSKSFNSFEEVPDFIVRSFITPSLFMDKVILPSNISEGQINKENVLLQFDLNNPENIIEFCSNGIVYGNTKFQAPRSFTSILKPCYTDTTFSFFAQMLSSTGYDQVLNDLDASYTVFMPSNSVFRADSIIMDEGDHFYYLNEDGGRGKAVSQPEIANIVLSSIVLDQVSLSDQVTYRKCLGGWYLGLSADSVWSGGNTVFDEDDNETLQPSLLVGSMEAPEIDNGLIHFVDHYVKAPELSTAQVIAQREEYSSFYNLCKQSGLYTDKGEFSFFAHPTRYTVFVPTNEVIASNLPSIPEDSLARVNFLLSHFVDGDIYNDGERSGILNSAMPDLVNSTDFEIVYMPVEVNNSTGHLQVKGSANGSFVEANSEDNVGNVICKDGVVQTLNGLLLNTQN